MKTRATFSPFVCFGHGMNMLNSFGLTQKIRDFWLIGYSKSEDGFFKEKCEFITKKDQNRNMGQADFKIQFHGIP